jgi:hypothetical protein
MVARLSTDAGRDYRLALSERTCRERDGMNDIDWSKAPAWANVVICAELGAHFWASSWGGQKLAENIQTGATQYATMYGDHCWHLVASRHEVVWSGEGLPPVGTVCECQDERFHWQRGTIVHVGKGDGAMVAVMQADNGILIGESGEFRQLRTPEQIAEEERQKALDVMVAECSLLDKGWSRLVCAGLYDAGYRRVEQ